jgi:hypothetical protein
MDVEAEELLQRVRVRNANLNNTTHYIPEDLMNGWIGFFQAPDDTELQASESEPGSSSAVHWASEGRKEW